MPKIFVKILFFCKQKPQVHVGVFGMLTIKTTHFKKIIAEIKEQFNVKKR